MASALYIHIPYCKSRCLYCDFCSMTDSDALGGYVEALQKEYGILVEKYPEALPFKTIFVGGGTPTALNSNDFKALVNFIGALPKVEDYEWTVEANPESLSREKLELLKSAGCNRLSIGLQDLDERVLKTIGRIHTAADFKTAYQEARATGFHNISADLMFGIPGQTLTSFEKTLAEIIALGPEHLSTYSLKIEEGTALAKAVEEGWLRPMDQETDRELYELVKAMLTKAGYCQYELSNFSKPGYESRHNLCYWHNEGFLALGLGSAYYWEQTRFENTQELDTYFSMINANTLPIGTAEKNSIETERYETLFLQLRLTEGLNVDSFQSRYGIDFQKIYGTVVEDQIKKGLMTLKDGVLTLTETGKDLSNQVFVDLMVED